MEKTANESYEVKTGEVFQVPLSSMSGSTGYSWELATLPVGISVVEIETKTVDGIGPCIKIFYLRSFKDGKYEIKFELRRCWENEPNPKSEVVAITSSSEAESDSNLLKMEGFVHPQSESFSAHPVVAYGVPTNQSGYRNLKYGMPPRMYYGAPVKAFYGILPGNSDQCSKDPCDE